MNNMNLENSSNICDDSGPYVFISYSHKDSAVVFPIVEAMSERGLRVWFDSGLEAGTEWQNSIADHVENCTVFVCFVSENSMNSEFCKDEIATAKSNPKKCIVDCLYIYIDEDIESKIESGVRMCMQRRQKMFMNRHNSMESFYKKLFASSIFEQCYATAAPKSTEIETHHVPESPKPTPVQTGKSISELLEEALRNIDLEQWDHAGKCCEKAISIDPDNAEAYLYRLMIEFKVSREADLSKLGEPIEESVNYTRLMRIGNGGLKARLRKYAKKQRNRVRFSAIEKKRAKHYDEDVAPEKENAKPEDKLYYLKDSMLSSKSYFLRFPAYFVALFATFIAFFAERASIKEFHHLSNLTFNIYVALAGLIFFLALTVIDPVPPILIFHRRPYFVHVTTLEITYLALSGVWFSLWAWNGLITILYALAYIAINNILPISISIVAGNLLWPWNRSIENAYDFVMPNVRIRTAILVVLFAGAAVLGVFCFVPI